ncbi:hypothetical protein ACLOJK_024356 [Asimina triloba]
MNPFFAQPSFTFLSQNPNPGFHFQQLPASAPAPAPAPAPPFLARPTLPPPPQKPDPNPPLPPNPTIQEAISAIDRSLSLAQSTLHSISNLLNLPFSNPSETDLIPCLFNPHHLLPPHSLFSHFLSCSSSPAVVSVSLLDCLRYPTSLLDPSNESRFPESEADLCLSLDEYIGFGSSSFFYNDCPGVVGTSDLCAVKRTFILPAILSVECENFSRGGGYRGIRKEVFTRVSLLPSDLWAVRTEVMAWSDYPASYSYSVLRAVCCLERMQESDILKWIIGNSPQYGIVIDVAMRDHLFVILKLCMAAILRESLKLLDSVMIGESGSGEKLHSRMLECPHFAEVLMWLGSQLSILYGDINGKVFAIQIIFKCLLSAGSCSMLHLLGEQGKQDVNDTETSWARNKIFVSQVAAAIAALHERSLLEETIKELRFGRPHSKIKLVDELSAVSTRANEERSKRPDYRAIIEHDGLLWQQPSGQGNIRNKTREELLAEERDYKRRRMSYRAKKVKRTTIEVLRDIIEQHMEEIKQAGGIGCSAKGAHEPVSGSDFDRTSTAAMLKGSRQHSVETYRSHADVYQRQVDTGCGTTSNRLVDARTVEKLGTSNVLKDVQLYQTYEHHASSNPREYHKRSVSKDSHNKEYRSRSPHSYRGHSKSYEWHGHQREDDIKGVANKYERNGSFSSHGSKDWDNQSSLVARDSTMSKHDRMPDGKDRQGHRKHQKHKSDTVTQGNFDDRYDPSGSYDRYKEPSRVSPDSKYTRPDRPYSPTDDAKQNKMQRIDYSSEVHHNGHWRKS